MSLRKGQNSRIGRPNQTAPLIPRPSLEYKQVVRTRTRVRAGLRILVLTVFVAVTLGIPFFHSESGPAAKNDCPACHFLTSSLSTSPGPVFQVPALLCQGTLPAAEPCSSNEVFVLSLASRSPPQA